MEKRVINPWIWQDARSYVQAVEITNRESTLYISGQTAIDHNRVSSNANMRDQLTQTLQNLEKVIHTANFELKNIVRLNTYTTSTTELFESFDIFQKWIEKNDVKQTSTVLEVRSLFETLKVEIEATIVK